MKRIACLLLALLLVGMQPVAHASSQVGEGTVIHEDENFLYWTAKASDGDLALWGQAKEPGSKEYEICTNFREFHFKNGYALVVFYSGGSWGGSEMDLSLIMWEQNQQTLKPKTANIINLMNYSDGDGKLMLDRLIGIGTYIVAKDGAKAYYVAFALKNGMWLWLSSVWIPNKGTLSYLVDSLGKFDSIYLHGNNFFYLANSKGELSTLLSTPLQEEIGRKYTDRNKYKPKAQQLGKMLKNAVPVDGVSYLGWLTAKNEAAYTIDGFSAITLSQFPKGTSFEFYEGFLVAKYEDFWFTKIVPGEEGMTSLSSKEYDRLPQEFGQLHPLP